MNSYAVSLASSGRTKSPKYQALTKSESRADLTDSTPILPENRSQLYKIFFVFMLIFIGYHLSDPNRDLTLLSFKDHDEEGQGQYFYYKPDDNRDWFPTGHYRGNTFWNLNDIFI